MTSQDEIASLFATLQWKKIAIQYAPEEIIHCLAFKDLLRLAYQLLYNEEWDEDFQRYAARLLEEIRHIHSNDWNRSWEYDALLGSAYDITYQHEKRFESYSRAFSMALSPPSGLLIELARCCICPGVPPISYDRAIQLITEAIKDNLYIDGISLLCNIYSLKEDLEKKKYWSNLLAQSERMDSPVIDPKFLVDNYLERKAKGIKIS